MERHVIVGGGGVATHTARRLVDQEHAVRVVTRSGRSTGIEGVEHVAADAADADRLVELTSGAAALYNCANPSGYHLWAKEWPPLAAALLTAAERTGAVLVTMSNLYAYGPGSGVMTEETPPAAPGPKGRLRAQMWDEARQAHEAGRVRVTEARASDFFGPHSDQAHLGPRFVPRVIAGKRLTHIASPDVPHSWTYLPDVGRTLAVLGTDDRAWGRPWHVPTNPPQTYREMAIRTAELAGAPAPRISSVPGGVLKTLGVFAPLFRELAEVRYQFDEPFVVDSSAFTETFDIGPTPLDQALTETIEWFRSRPT